MREGWEEVRLGDIIHVKHGAAFKGKYFVEEQTKDILVTPGNFAIGGGFKSDKMKYYKGPMIDGYILFEGDIIVTMTDLSKQADTLGYSAKVPKDDNKYLHNQRIGLVSLLTDNYDTDYIYWLLRTHSYQRYIAGSSSGATVKHTSPKKIYSAKLIVVKSKETQRKIASILSAYDDLIENNLKRIKLLEELAQQTYEEWFVRFKFPGYKNVAIDSVSWLPVGWERKRFDKLMILQRGFDLPARLRKNGKVPIYASTGITDYHNEYKVKGPGIITGRSGTLGQVEYTSANFWPLNTALWVKKYFSCGPLYALHFLRSLNLENFGGGSAVPSLDRKVVHSQKILIPNLQIITDFENYCLPKFKIIDNLTLQNQLLKEARDILLPRLMGGLVDVESLGINEELGTVAEMDARYEKK